MQGRAVGLRKTAGGFVVALTCLLGGSEGHATEPVDLALILAVDVSESVDGQEALAQRQGYIQALQSSEVVDAILSGRRGRIAVTYIEWAGPDHLFVILDWAVIDNMASARDFAARLKRQEITHGYTTSITSLLRRTPAIFARLSLEHDHRDLDISGDGTNNDGRYVLHARDRLLEAGVTINGLPILNDRPAPSGYPRLEDLSGYFTNCVVGGPGSFQIAAESFEDFATAIQLKMVREIAALAPSGFHPQRRFVATSVPYDCNIGEKQSRRRILEKFETTGTPEQQRQ